MSLDETKGNTLRITDEELKISESRVQYSDKSNQGWTTLSAQIFDGGWSGMKLAEPAIEEIALAVDALTGSLLHSMADSQQELAVRQVISCGVRWLIEKTHHGISLTASPIGLYFARLWYFEELYPMIFTLSALRKVQKLDRIVEI